MARAYMFVLLTKEFLITAMFGVNLVLIFSLGNAA